MRQILEEKGTKERTKGSIGRKMRKKEKIEGKEEEEEEENEWNLRLVDQHRWGPGHGPEMVSEIIRSFHPPNGSSIFS